MTRSLAWLYAGIVAFCCLHTSTVHAFCWPWEHGFTAAAGYTRTRHPIVLVHGAFGFDSVGIAGINITDYWYDLDNALADCDGASVYVVQLSPANTPEYRGEQLLAQLEHIRAQTGAAKLNVIAHSMGGLDARYVMQVRPDMFASLTTIGSPHKGGRLFDTVASGINADGSPLNWLANALGDAMQLFWRLVAGDAGTVDGVMAMRTLQTANARTWNKSYPAGIPSDACGEGASSYRGIALYSWTGNAPVPWTTSLNPLVALDGSFNLLFGTLGALSGEASDGLVAVCSAHFGDVLRDDYSWNHPDEVNQLWGLTADFDVDARTEFRKHAHRLKGQGL